MSTTVVVVSVGTQGPAGATSSMVASGAIGAAKAVRTGATGKAVLATTDLRTRPFLGLSLTGASDGANVAVWTSGPVSRTLLNLGAGVACAVGVKTDGTPVRATDVLCVSAPNWLGTCDADGTVTVAPVRKPDFDVTDYGAVPDSDGAGGGTDSLAAFDAAIRAAGQFGGSYQNTTGGSARVWIPPGRYRFSDSLHIVYGVALEGSIGTGNQSATVLVFDEGVGGDDIEDAAVVVDFVTTTPPGTTGGLWALLKNFVIMAAGGGNPNGQIDNPTLTLCNGFRAKAPFQMEHVMISSFSGDGLIIYGNTGGSPVTAVNNWYLGGSIRVEYCGRYGMIVHGSDSSAGACSAQLDLSGNGSWGLFESSFFGNFYAKIHTAENGCYVHPAFDTWYRASRDCTDKIWTSEGPVSQGDLVLPPVVSRSGFQYRAQNDGTFGVSEPVWPTSIGGTVVSGDVTIECWMPEGGSIFTSPAGAHINFFAFVYAELDQNPAEIHGDIIASCDVDFELSLNSEPREGGWLRGRKITPYTLYTRRQESWEDIQDYPLKFEIGGATNASNTMMSWDASLIGDSPANGWYKDYGRLRWRWDPNTTRWIHQWGEFSNYGYSWTQCGGRSLPKPGAVCWGSLWLAGNPTFERRITSLEALDDTTLNSAYLAQGAYQPGDVVINNTESTATPWAWRVTAKGGFADQTWAAGAAVRPGDTIRPGTGGDSLFRAQNQGTTGAMIPAFDDTPGASYVDGDVTWEQWGVAGVHAEPLPNRGAAQADSVAGDVATLKTDFNALLAKLRTANVIAT